MDMKKTILIVDDNNVYRKKLIADLRDAGFDVEGVESGEKGVNLVEENPQRFQFAVIDQILKEGEIGGIEAASKISNINRKVFILVFTNLWFDEEDKAKYEYEALSAGAHRYIQRSSPEEGKKDIVAFVNEIKQLSELSEWIKNYHEQRSNVPSLLTQLDIGMDIIDQSHKVWFMNEDFRRITGYKEMDLPKRPCPVWHGYCLVRCFGCIVEYTIEDTKNHNEIFLSPLPYRESGKLFYMNVWTQALKKQDGSLLLSSDGRPLAVIESVQDLTESKDIQDMPLEQRLDIIAGSLQSCPVNNKYLPTQHFRHVKICCLAPGSKGQFALMATAGYRTKFVLGKQMNLRPEELYSSALRKMHSEGTGLWQENLGRTDPLDISIPADRFALWPVIDNGHPVAWIEVSGNNCSEDSVAKVEPFANEVLFAIENSRRRYQIAISDSVEYELGQIENKLQTVASPKEALLSLVTAACQHTDSYLPVIRYVQGDQAVLLPLGFEQPNAYEKVAELKYSLSHGSSWSVSTINSQQTQCTSSTDVIRERQAVLSEEARLILKDVKSLCFEPLFYNNQCIGSFGLHSRHPDSYDEPQVKLVREIAKRVAGALHDFLLDKRIDQRVKEELDRFTTTIPLTESGDLPKKIFFSHKTEDKPLVRDFKATLDSLGLAPWLDEDAMVAGKERDTAILEGMEDSCAVVFFITPNFSDEGYIHDEIIYAKQQKDERKDKFAIISLLLEDTKEKQIPKLLKRYVWKEPKTANEALQEIIRGLPIEVAGFCWKKSK